MSDVLLNAPSRRRPTLVRSTLSSCAFGLGLVLAAVPGVSAQTPWREGPRLPVAMANNSVVGVEVTNEGPAVFSMLGLLEGKSWQDVTSRAFRWNVGSTQWREIAPVPGPGRLASTAQAVDGKVYLFGGYVVAEDGSEVSLPNVDVYDPDSDSWTRAADMPVPVDDAVSGIWQDSLIVLVSGWSDGDNVANVQIYSPRADSWTQASPIPGLTVFGHTGAITRDRIVYIDGVERRAEGRPRYAMAPATWMGTLDPQQPQQVNWVKLPDHPGLPLYRAAGLALGTRILFLGGSDNPYNYDGIGYNGVPSEPTGEFIALDVETGAWTQLPRPPVPTMDHRTLARAGGMVVLAGGMLAGQVVSDRLWYAPVLEMLARQ